MSTRDSRPLESPSWSLLARKLAQEPANSAVEAGVPRAAVALILREEAGGVDHELLFIRRSEHPNDPWSGHMAFPGGRAEPADPDGQATARRETLEEVGVDLERDGIFLGRLADICPALRASRLNVVVSPFVFGVAGSVSPEPLSEVASVHWWRLTDLADPSRAGRMHFEHDGRTIEAPCIRIDGRVIWGLSYRMLLALQAVLATP